MQNSSAAERRFGFLRNRRLGRSLILVLVLLAGMLAGSYITASTSWAPFGKRSQAAVPVYLETGPTVSDEVSLRAGLEPVVRAVRNSVVSIVTTKRVQARGFDLFFDDPFFRRFFGLPEGPREFLQQGLGSGVIVSPEGYILTNNHVVEGATDLKVILADRRELAAKAVGTDPKTDIAVLRVEAKGLPAIALGDSSRVRVGDFVLAIGSPFGLELRQSVTFGIVSATGRGNLNIADYGDFIQTDAAINPGNSGGALVNMQGQLIGINTAIVGAPANVGIGFAIPVNMARGVMDQILKHGRVIRGYLGVTIQDLSEALAEQFGVKTMQGALVSSVAPDSPAERAGLRRGDVIIEFNGQKVNDSTELKNMVGLTPPGTKVSLKLIRNGKEQTVTVELGELREAGAGRFGPGLERESALSGIAVEELTPWLRQRYDLPATLKGVIITDLAPGSPAAEAGLRPGDVIQEVNRQPIGSVRDFQEAAARAGNRRAVLLVYFSRQGSSAYIVLEPRG